MLNNRPLRIGSRASRLAVVQAEWITSLIKSHWPDLAVQWVPITTTGDKDLTSSLPSLGGKGVFVKEIEEALFKNEIDLAVHSLKDVPQSLPDGLILGPFPQREDPRDAVISRFGEMLNELPKGSIIGTSSPRRVSQIQRLYKKRAYRFEALRGNVETRIRKVKEGVVDAAILALAGLRRLGLEKEVTQILEEDEMMSAPGQGCLGLELRRDDGPTSEILKPLAHTESDHQARAERSFLQALGGTCLVPVGTRSRHENDQLIMDAALWNLSGDKEVRVQEKGPWEQPELVGAKLAGRLLYEGGSELMLELDGAVPPSSHAR